MEPRTIRMTDDQVQEAMRHSTRGDAINRLMEEFISSMIDQISEQRNGFWDGVARVFGYANLADATGQGVKLRICWVTRSFVAEPIGGGE